MPSHYTTPAIEAQNLTKQVTSPEGALTILNRVNLSIEQGEACAIVGASGSGKSTLIGLLAGLDTPTSGHVRLDGVDLGSLDEDGRARHRAGRVGFVFQSFQLLPSLTALENVMLPLELAGDAAASRSARDVLARVGLRERAGHYPNQLSGGEQQRVAIARAFAARPRILFADEPTGNLDLSTGRKVATLLFELNREESTTLVLVTHDEKLASQCGRRVKLVAGRIPGSTANRARRSRKPT